MTTMTAPAADLVGQFLAGERYRVERVLGTGSMGHVYLARDVRLDSNVVIKVPTSQRLADPEFHERFLRESQFLVKLSHPAIVKVMDIGDYEADGQMIPYFVMQYVDGGSLRDRMRGKDRRIRPMKPHTLNRWLTPVAEALDFMHARKCIHRDVKPANILFDTSNHPFMSDFGLSKLMSGATADADDDKSELTGAGAIVGTPNYVAPEIVLGQSYTGRADQYSLACTVYEVLAGRPPLEGPSASATMVNQTAKKPTPLHQVRPGIPVALAKVVHKALAKNPANRFSSCNEFAENVIEAGIDANSSSVSSASNASAATLVQSSPQYVVVATKRVVDGESNCPACSHPIKLKPVHAGRKGRCVNCGVKLSIAKDLREITQLKLSPIAKARGGQSKSAVDREFSLEIGEKVFGFEVSKSVAIGLVVVTVATILVMTAVVSKQAAEMDDKPEVHAKILSEQ